MTELVVAVDPGRDKCGIAVVHKKGCVLVKKVVNTPDLAPAVAGLLKDYAAGTVVLGDRTGSAEARRVIAGLKSRDLQFDIIGVDEHRSSDEARLRYWRDHPPRGLMRLVPIGLQTPAEPVDDYVAVILAERFFARLKQDK